MKYILTFLVAIGLMTRTANAQQDTDSGGPTYSGKVVGASDTDNDGVNDTFDVELDGNGVADQTVEAKGKDGTETVAVGMPVKYKLRKLTGKDKDKPRKGI